MTHLFRTLTSRRKRAVAVAAVMALGAALLWLGRSFRASRGFPGAHWEHLAPERAGFDPDRLAAFIEWVGGHGLIVRHGRVAAWWGLYSHRLDVASACKPVLAHFVFAAIGEGRIRDLDEPVVLPDPLSESGSDGVPTSVGDKLKAITWRHLLRQTAGYGVEESPGTAFNYSDYQAALLADALVRKVYGVGYGRADREILERLLGGPLRFQDGATLTHAGSRSGRLRISARDFARFGLLYLNQGRWRCRQIIPRRFADKAVATPLPADFPRTQQEETPMLAGQRSLGGGPNLEAHLGSSSFMWWVNGEPREGERLFPDLPPDLFLAQGHSGHDVLLVIPSLDLVVCWIDADLGGGAAARYSGDGYLLVQEAIRRLRNALTIAPPAWHAPVDASASGEIRHD